MTNAMTPDEARTLLTRYADGLLEGRPALELELLLKQSPDLQDELKKIKEENALLEEALAPLRPSQSARMRLSDAMLNVHRQATTVAKSMPVRGWRIFRLVFCLAALGGAALLIQYRPPAPAILTGNPIFLYTIVGLFALGLLFVLAGSALAKFEARMKAGLTRETVSAGALEVLMVQVFGVFAVLAAFGMYFYL